MMNVSEGELFRSSRKWCGPLSLCQH